MRAWFSLFGFQSWQVNIEVCFVILSKVVVIFWFVRTVVLNVSWSLEFTYKCCMIPLPAVLALEYSWIYICSSDYSNETSYIERTVNKCFCWVTTLCIPDIYLYNHHVRSRQYLNYSRFGSNLNVIKDVSHFDDIFYIASINGSIHIFSEV